MDIYTDHRPPLTRSQQEIRRGLLHFASNFESYKAYFLQHPETMRDDYPIVTAANRLLPSLLHDREGFMHSAHHQTFPKAVEESVQQAARDMLVLKMFPDLACDAPGHQVVLQKLEEASFESLRRMTTELDRHMEHRRHVPIDERAHLLTAMEHDMERCIDNLLPSAQQIMEHRKRVLD